MNMLKRNKDAFTLVEVALSLLVVGVGLLSVFSLFPAGLKMNKQAIDETQAALFAEEVLNGVRAQTAILDWNDLRIALPPVAPEMWENPTELVVGVTFNKPENYYETLRYIAKGPRSVAGKEYRDYGIRYRLEIVDIDARRKGVTLRVRPGEYGPENPSYVFYTELYNHGMR